MWFRLILPMVLVLSASVQVNGKPIHHYVFFGMDREKLKQAKSFLEVPAFEGAQVTYSWRQLEHEKDKYDFSLIREDLEFLNARGKKLWVQFQDVTFSPDRINVPKYLLEDPKYNGGADKQYRIRGDDETDAVHEGWMARRYDAAVQERLHKLFLASVKSLMVVYKESILPKPQLVTVGPANSFPGVTREKSIAMPSSPTCGC